MQLGYLNQLSNMQKWRLAALCIKLECSQVEEQEKIVELHICQLYLSDIANMLHVL